MKIRFSSSFMYDARRGKFRREVKNKPGTGYAKGRVRGREEEDDVGGS